MSDWRRHRQSTHRVYYETKGTRVFERESSSPSDNLRSEDVVLEARRNYVLDFRNNYVRLEMEGPQPYYGTEEKPVFELWDMYEVHLLDGKQQQIYEPKSRNPWKKGERKYDAELEIAKLGEIPFFFQPIDLAILYAETILPQKNKRAGYWQNLRPPIDPSLFRVFGTASREGKTFTVLRSDTIKQSSKSFFDVWVDPENASEIIRYIHYLKDRAKVQFDFWYLKTEDGRRLARIRRGRPWPDGKIVYDFDLKVVKYIKNYEEGKFDFSVTPTPEMIVKDRTTDTRYRAGDGVDVRVLYQREQRAKKTFAANLLRYGYIIGSLALAGGLFWWWAKRKNKS